MSVSAAPAPLLRTELGGILRDLHCHQGRTLREISSGAQVPPEYLSEAKRDQREASSEPLGAICLALGVPLWFVLRGIFKRMTVSSGIVVPDTVPEDLVPVTLIF